MYEPTSPPHVDSPDASTMMNYLYDELRSIADIMQGIGQGQYMKITTVAPVKPREPQIAFADGTHWNPGSGKGLYVYYAGAWHFAG